MSKILFIILLVLSFSNTHGQQDTIVTYMSDYQISKLGDLSAQRIVRNENDTVYYINNNFVSKLEYQVAIARSDSVDDYYVGKYIIFMKGKNRIEEGVWGKEGYIGSYKSYYKNGQLSVSGQFNLKSERICCWYYYKKNGKCRFDDYSDDENSKYDCKCD